MRQDIYFEDWLPPFQEEITAETYKRRNKAISWQFIQVCSSIAGFLCYLISEVFDAELYGVLHIDQALLLR